MKKINFKKIIRIYNIISTAFFIATSGIFEGQYVYTPFYIITFFIPLTLLTFVNWKDEDLNPTLRRINREGFFLLALITAASLFKSITFDLVHDK